MAVYYRYTLTSKKNIYCLFKCEKCGKLNITKVEVRGRSQYSTRGAYTRRRLEDRKEQAEMYSKSDMEENAFELSNGANYNLMKELQLRCQCEECHKAPSWTFRLLPLLKKLADITLIPFLLLFLATLATNDRATYLVWILGGIAAAAWAARLLYPVICEANCKRHSSPLFAESVEELKAKASRYIEYKDLLK